jgi:hypothetical protein
MIEASLIMNTKPSKRDLLDTCIRADGNLREGHSPGWKSSQDELRGLPH